MPIVTATALGAGAVATKVGVGTAIASKVGLAAVAAKVGTGFAALGPFGPMMLKAGASGIVRAAIPAMLGRKNQQQSEVSY